MHPYALPAHLIASVTSRAGRAHPFDTLVASKTAFLVVDMQNYFMHPEHHAAVAMARDIVPHVNRLAAALRAAGGHVVWVKNASNDTRESWSVYHDWLMTPERRERRYAAMDTGHEGHALWHALEPRPEDGHIIKKRFSAFIQGSSDIVPYLRGRGIDTVLVGGTATNVCCESTARDAMMLNFKTVMVPDALAALSDAEHAATLNTFYAMFGDVQSVDEVIASLARGRNEAVA